MATVPQYEIGQKRSSAVGGGQQQIQTLPEAFGSSIAQANIQRGQVLSQLGDQAWNIAIEQRDQHDQATLRDQDNLLSSFIRQKMSDPDGYLHLTGKAAVDQKAIVEKEIEEYRKSLSKGIEQRILNQWNSVSDQRVNTAFNNITSHAFQQTEAWNQQAREARIASSILNVGANYSNPKQLALELNLGLREVDSQIRDVWGIDPMNPSNEDEAAIVNNARIMFTTKSHQAVIDNLLATDRYIAAQTYYENNKDQIDSGFYDEIETSLRSHTRQGETFSETKRILAMGLSHSENLAEARNLPDSTLAAAVVQELKTRKTEGDNARTEDQTLAKRDVLASIANGARSRNDIDVDLWNRMSGAAQNEIEVIFQQHIDAQDARDDEAQREEFEVARNNAYRKLDLGEEITADDLEAMSGTDRFQFQQTARTYLKNTGTDKENIAYDEINDLISQGNTFDQLPKDVWDKMSGLQKRTLKAILDAKAEKTDIDLENDAYEQAAALVADGQAVPSSTYNALNGLQKLAITEKIESRARTEKTTTQDDAYNEVLKHLLIPTNTLKNLPVGLWERLSGVHQTSIQNAINETQRKQAVVDLATLQQKNWMILSDMAVNDYTKFLQQDLNAYVGLVSDANLSKLLTMQQDKNQSYIHGTRDSHLKIVLANLGLNYEDAAKEKGDGPDIRRFIEQAEAMAQALQAEQGKVTDQDYQGILIKLATDLVWNEEGWGQTQEALILVDDFENAYVEVGEEKVWLKDIKDVERAEIMTVLNTHRITTSSQNIGALSTVPAEDREQIITAMKANNITVTVRGILDAYHINK